MKTVLIVCLAFYFNLLTGQEIQYVNKGLYQIEQEDAIFYRLIYHDSIRDGSVLIKHFKIDSTLTSSGFYDKTDYKFKNGPFVEYYDSGEVKYVKNYSNNKLNGELVGYFKNGNVRRKEFYSDDSLVSGECYTLDGVDTAFYPMVILPKFKGGHYTHVRNYIAKKIIYPAEALFNDIEGDVVLYFCIDKKGKVCDVEVVYSDYSPFNKQCVNKLKRTSKYWEVGYAEGNAAKISFTIPIKFRLN